MARSKSAQQAWAKAHREERRIYMREWARKQKEKDPEGYKEERRAIAARGYKKHPEVYRARSSEYRKNNPEKVKASVDKWFEENKEYRRQYKKEYRRTHKETIAQYRRDNPDKHRAYKHNRRTRQTNAGGTFTEKEWVSLCKKYGHKCLDCGKRRKLTADHIIPVSKGGTSNIENIQPLCGPCNSKKGRRTIDFRTKRRQ
jgi:5-methylcytosine-specific restriction endonuclease McrA